MATATTNSIAILSARGAFYRVPLDNSNAPGMYAVAGLNRPDPSAAPVVAASGSKGATSGSSPDTNYPILISGISTTQSDIVSQVSCLENVKVIYSFGQNFGQLIISGEVLMGPSSQSNKGAIKQIQDYFWKYRVSTRLLPVSVSISENAFYVYLTGLEIHDVVVDFHILPFVMYGILLDLSRDTSSLINPKALVLTGGNLTSSSVQNALSQRKSALQVPDITTGVSSNADGSTTMPAILPNSATSSVNTTSDSQIFNNLMSAESASDGSSGLGPLAGQVNDAAVPSVIDQATGQTPVAADANTTSDQDSATLNAYNYDHSTVVPAPPALPENEPPVSSPDNVVGTGNIPSENSTGNPFAINSTNTTGVATDPETTNNINTAIAQNQTPSTTDTNRAETTSLIPAEQAAEVAPPTTSTNTPLVILPEMKPF